MRTIRNFPCLSECERRLLNSRGALKLLGKGSRDVLSSVLTRAATATPQRASSLAPLRRVVRPLATVPGPCGPTPPRPAAPCLAPPRSTSPRLASEREHAPDHHSVSMPSSSSSCASLPGAPSVCTSVSHAASSERGAPSSGLAAGTAKRLPGGHARRESATSTCRRK